MLDHLSTINWSELSHAYGSAEDVPQLLRDLASHDEQVRRGALGTLYTTLYHQGTIYQASASAVPFLIELVQQPELVDREEILILLAHLAQGNTYHRQHWHMYSEQQKQDPTVLAQLEQGIFWVERTCEAVEAGLPLYWSLLADQNIRIRMAALFMLGALTRVANQILPLLGERFEADPDERVQASLVLAMGDLLAGQEEMLTEAWQVLIHVLDAGPTDLVRVAAALALVRTSSPEIPAHAYEVLLASIQYPDSIGELYEELPWADQRLCFQAIASLRLLPPSHDADQLPRWLHFLRSLAQREETSDFRLNQHLVSQLAEVLVKLTFRGKNDREALPVEQLTDFQKTVLTTLVECDQVWHWNTFAYNNVTRQKPEKPEESQELCEITCQTHHSGLARKGLPASRQKLRASLGLEPQETDALRILSPDKDLWYKLRTGEKTRILADLAAYNPPSTLAALIRQVGS